MKLKSNKRCDINTLKVRNGTWTGIRPTVFQTKKDNAKSERREYKSKLKNLMEG